MPHEDWYPTCKIGAMAMPSFELVGIDCQSRVHFHTPLAYDLIFDPALFHHQQKPAKPMLLPKQDALS